MEVCQCFSLQNDKDMETLRPVIADTQVMRVSAIVYWFKAIGYQLNMNRSNKPNKLGKSGVRDNHVKLAQFIIKLMEHA
jgi:hypothetical protein